ncbi:MAG: tetratricopeptide repeat protein [Candidatus Krumholzibacteriia bacterium]
MKICPFISHMLGDDNASTLTLGQGSSQANTGGDAVVVLGYEGDKAPSTGTVTKARATKGSKKDVPSHLECMKDACRFYKAKSDDCQFDLIFSMLEKPPPAAPRTPDSSKDISGQVSKDIDKIWKFQTQSVAELVKSLGESEKNQSRLLADMQKAFEKKIDALQRTDGGPLSDDVSKKLDALQKQIGSIPRDESKAATHEVTKKIDSLQKKIDSLPAADGKAITDEMTRKIDTLEKKIESLRKADDKAGSDEIVKKIESLQKKIDTREGSIEDLTATVSEIVLDLRQNFNKIQAHTEDMSKQLEHSSKSGGAPIAEVKNRLETALKSQQEMESKMSAWHDTITAAVKDLQSQQKTWTVRLDSLAENQEDLLGYMEDGKKHRNNERERHGKKEAKKFNNLGVTSFHNGAYEMARDQFLEAVRVDPEFAEAYNNLGLAYTELNDEEKASEAFTRAVEISPALHAAYNNLGYIFFKRGHYDQAVEMYNEALGRSTNNSSAYTNLGNAYYKMGKTDDAYQAWSKAVEIDPSNEKAKKNLQRISAEVK